MRRRYVVGAVLFLVACDSAVQPRASEPVTLSAAPFLISNPSHATTASLLTSDGSANDVVYISLPPDAIADGVEATIAVIHTTVVTTVPIVSGGFDPVAIRASLGDTIEVIARRSTTPAPVKRRVPVQPASPPVIVRTDPPSNKRDVPLNANIVVVFSEPIAAPALNSSTITLTTAATEVPGTLSFADVAHTKVQFTPAEPLTSGTDFSLLVTTGVRDLDAMPIAAKFTLSFSTVEASPPTTPAALTITRTEPIANRNNVPRLNPWLEVWFSEPVLAVSAYEADGTSRLQLLLDGVPVNADLGGFYCHLDASTRDCARIGYAPSTPLLPGRSYELVVRPGISTRSGAVLEHERRIPFTVENPPPGPSAAALSVASFSMIEFTYPSAPDWWFYAPQVTLAETGGTSSARIVSFRFSIDGFGGPFPALCANAVTVPASQRLDLFHESYGDFEVTFDKGVAGIRATGTEATGTIIFRDDAGRIDSLALRGPIVPGALPATYTGGVGHYYGMVGSCERGAEQSHVGAHLHAQ